MLKSKKKVEKSRNYIVMVIIAVLLLSISCCAVFSAQSSDDSRFAHKKYMNGSSDGFFHPDDPINRGEAAVIVYKNLPEDTAVSYNMPFENGSGSGSPQFNADFSDVSSGDWYFEAVRKLASLGIMTGNDGLFRPGDLITRAEFVKIISFLDLTAPPAAAARFSDVPEDNWAYPYIALAASKGWVNGYEDGTFGPGNTITRAEAVVITNRVTGRNADRSTVKKAEGIRIFPDVDLNHWAYLPIMEASISHDYEPLGTYENWTEFNREGTVIPPGYHIFNNILYHVSTSTKDFVSDRSEGKHYYDRFGRYTTLNAELDGYVRDITGKLYSEGMSMHDLLHACFDYVLDNYGYMPRELYAPGAEGWEEKSALGMFRKGSGNCYYFTGAFYYLAMNCGYEPELFAGTVHTRTGNHGWAEININNTWYIYDITQTYGARRENIPGRYLFEIPVDRAPIVYYRAEDLEEWERVV